MTAELGARPRSIGLVLSGGGARGAYEVGVLQHIADELPEILDRVTVINGSSVGAVNGVFLASQGVTAESVRRLASVWRRLRMDDLLKVSGSGALKMARQASLRMVGRAVTSPVEGLLSVERLWKLVAQETDWRGLHRVIKSGRLDAVAVAATDISSGHTHLFIEHGDHLQPVWSRDDPSLVPRRVTLGPHHVLASSAIPLLFPPVKAQGRWYMDGGLRYNTPLSPALSLGAESLMIVNVRAKALATVPAMDFPGIGHVIGKLLDSVFLDRLDFDLDRLQRINDVLHAVAQLPADAQATFRAAIVSRGRRQYRHVPFATVQPSTDLGQLAADYLDSASPSRMVSFGRFLWALLEDDARTSGDAASFLLFDGGFAHRLIEAGRQDAEAAHADLAKVL